MFNQEIKTHYLETTIYIITYSGGGVKGQSVVQRLNSSVVPVG